MADNQGKRTFAENLRGLEVDVANIEDVEISLEGTPVAIIPNQEGKRGSVAVYAHLAKKYDGLLGPEQAQEGLDLYAEHTQDARKFPGKHPNIDRLFEIVERRKPLTIRVNYRGS